MNEPKDQKDEERNEILKKIENVAMDLLEILVREISKEPVTIKREKTTASATSKSEPTSATSKSEPIPFEKPIGSNKSELVKSAESMSIFELDKTKNQEEMIPNDMNLAIVLATLISAINGYNSPHKSLETFPCSNSKAFLNIKQRIQSSQDFKKRSDQSIKFNWEEINQLFLKCQHICEFISRSKQSNQTEKFLFMDCLKRITLIQIDPIKRTTLTLDRKTKVKGKLNEDSIYHFIQRVVMKSGNSMTKPFRKEQTLQMLIDQILKSQMRKKMDEQRVDGFKLELLNLENRRVFEFEKMSELLEVRSKGMDEQKYVMSDEKLMGMDASRLGSKIDKVASRKMDNQSASFRIKSK